MEKKCEHKNRRKLFWMDWRKAKWVKTNLAYCLECKQVIEEKVSLTLTKLKEEKNGRN